LIERDSSLKNSLKRELNSFKSIEIPKIDLNKVILHRIDSKKLNLSKNEVKKPSLIGEYPGKNNKLSFF
jgi:sortase (surface protein transpeptidase)